LPYFLMRTVATGAHYEAFRCSASRDFAAPQNEGLDSVGPRVVACAA
jgi:hypothetical protein